MTIEQFSRKFNKLYVDNYKIQYIIYPFTKGIIDLFIYDIKNEKYTRLTCAKDRHNFVKNKEFIYVSKKLINMIGG